MRLHEAAGSVWLRMADHGADAGFFLWWIIAVARSKSPPRPLAIIPTQRVPYDEAIEAEGSTTSWTGAVMVGNEQFGVTAISCRL